VPLRRTSWLALFCAVTLAADASLLLRRGRPGAAPCPAAAKPQLPKPQLPRPQLPRPRLPSRPAALLGAAVLIAACGVLIARAGVALQPAPAFTELWLSPGGGQARVASLGVSNQQGVTTRYRLTLLRRGKARTTWTFSLPSGKTWQRAVSYDPRYPMAANLYRLPDLRRPYRHVTTPGQETRKQ